jgi:hypothetical protein
MRLYCTSFIQSLFITNKWFNKTVLLSPSILLKLQKKKTPAFTNEVQPWRTRRLRPGGYEKTPPMTKGCASFLFFTVAWTDGRWRPIPQQRSGVPSRKQPLDCSVKMRARSGRTRRRPAKVALRDFHSPIAGTRALAVCGRCPRAEPTRNAIR